MLISIDNNYVPITLLIWLIIPHILVNLMSLKSLELEVFFRPFLSL